MAKLESDCNDKYKANNYDKSIFKNQKKFTCIIIGINSFKNKISDENKSKFGDVFKNANDLGIIDFIFIDTLDKIKLFEYESWYKQNVNSNKRIWL